MVSKPDTRQCASEDPRSPRGVGCEIPYWLERGTKHSLQGRGNLSVIDSFYNWKPRNDSSKRTIFASNGLGRLHINLQVYESIFQIPFMQISELLDCTTWSGVGPGLMDAVTKGAMQAGNPVGGFKIGRESGEWSSSKFHPYLPTETYFTCR